MSYTRRIDAVNQNRPRGFEAEKGEEYNPKLDFFLEVSDSSSRRLPHCQRLLTGRELHHHRSNAPNPKPVWRSFCVVFPENSPFSAGRSCNLVSVSVLSLLSCSLRLFSYFQPMIILRCQNNNTQPQLTLTPSNGHRKIIHCRMTKQ